MQTVTPKNIDEHRAQILESIKLIAKDEGKPPGMQKFQRITGIGKHSWYPNLWLRWGDALKDAGFSPQTLSQKIPASILAEHYVELIRKLGRIPLSGETRLESQNNENFPSHSVFSRIGNVGLLRLAKQHCQGKEDLKGVLDICDNALKNIPAERVDDSAVLTDVSAGCVYLMKLGKHYKIGRTKSLMRRDKELKVEMPVPPETVHSIETDDPSGVEAYWHRRFDAKRVNGEWFSLDSSDVRAFRRWKKIF